MRRNVDGELCEDLFVQHCVHTHVLCMATASGCPSLGGQEALLGEDLSLLPAAAAVARCLSVGTGVTCLHVYLFTQQVHTVLHWRGQCLQVERQCIHPRNGG